MNNLIKRIQTMIGRPVVSVGLGVWLFLCLLYSINSTYVEYTSTTFMGLGVPYKVGMIPIMAIKNMMLTAVFNAFCMIAVVLVIVITTIPFQILNELRKVGKSEE